MKLSQKPVQWQDKYKRLDNRDLLLETLSVVLKSPGNFLLPI